MKTENRGGRRENAGRPKKPENEKKVYKTISLSGTLEEIEELKKLAENAEKTVSRFVISSILKTE